MTFQAFIDESYTEGSTYVLGGYIASEETWAKFSEDWRKLLPKSVAGKDGQFRFKMREMAAYGRMARVPEFYAIIEKYDLFSVSCKIDVTDVERAKERISVDNLRIYWGYTDNPYSLSFRCLMDMFHTNRPLLNSFFPPGQKIDFIFDERKEKKKILAMWDDYLRDRPSEVREYYGAHPRFEDDRDFIQLQAADFWVWWVRKWYDAGTPEKLEKQEFDGWKAIKTPKGMAISFSEDQIAEFFVTYLRSNLLGRTVYDAKYSPPPKIPEVEIEIVPWSVFWQRFLNRLLVWFSRQIRN